MTDREVSLCRQFVDPLILMRAVRLEARRRLAILVAEKSMRRKFIGWLSRRVGAVPVARAQDMTSPGTGRIYLRDPQQPLKIRGIGTKFTEECMAGGLLVLPAVGGRSAASSEIAEVVNDEEIVLKKEFKASTALQQLTAETADGKGTTFKKAPKVDQTMVYDAVFERLNSGGCVGIFPEGGSHDRTELLPLKAGVAIMALGALAANPDCDLKIVPAGLNYFHAHKFRSRAVVEFGNPIEVPKELVDMYRAGEKREAVRALLEIIYNGLLAVTVTSPDYDTLMVRCLNLVVVEQSTILTDGTGHSGCEKTVQAIPEKASASSSSGIESPSRDRLHPLQGRPSYHQSARLCL
jgi:glycerol-3-phosphate O-acyltransferase/dihydroxyacetone phosphate acyltransferase